MDLPFARDNILLGRGRVFFAAFSTPDGFEIDGGWRYIGNTDLINVAVATERAERYLNRGGRLVYGGSTVTKETCSGAFTTDNVSSENIADWFALVPVPAATGLTTVSMPIKWRRGRYFQLGIDDTHPTGLQKLESVELRINNILVPPAEYEVDMESGMLYIPFDSSLVEDSVVMTIAASRPNTDLVMRPSGRGVRGSLKFVANAIKGRPRDLFIPAVELRANGDQELKGDKWQELQFSYTAMHRPRHDLYYITHRTA